MFLRNMDAETIKLIKDSDERQRIINDYRYGRMLDRDYAIKLIIEKRQEDPKVLLVTQAAQFGKTLIPLEEASDEELIQELQMQVAAMEGKVAE
ncbi:MAG: hypothetical protein IJJ01_09445 [Firmicutes bacterium]|nr:hypothetical protein [Bacillota bacterium]